MAKTKGAPRQATVGKLPSKQQILDFLETGNVKSGKREIARAFGVKGGDRVALKELLRSMADEGLIAGSRRKLVKPGALPPVTVIEIVSRDHDGEFVARPATWDEAQGPLPRILMAESKRETGPAAGIGDRVLARITRLDVDADYPYQARTIKKLARAANRMLGIFRSLPAPASSIPSTANSSRNGRFRAGAPTMPRAASWSASNSPAEAAPACRAPASLSG